MSIEVLYNYTFPNAHSTCVQIVLLLLLCMLSMYLVTMM